MGVISARELLLTIRLLRIWMGIYPSEDRAKLSVTRAAAAHIEIRQTPISRSGRRPYRDQADAHIEIRQTPIQTSAIAAKDHCVPLSSPSSHQTFPARPASRLWCEHYLYVDDDKVASYTGVYLITKKERKNRAFVPGIYHPEQRCLPRPAPYSISLSAVIQVCRGCHDAVVPSPVSLSLSLCVCVCCVSRRNPQRLASMHAPSQLTHPPPSIP